MNKSWFEAGRAGQVVLQNLYVAYHDYGDNPVRIELLSSEKYEETLNFPSVARLYTSIIPMETEPSAPNVSIVTITEFDELDQERIWEIKREVMNWLMDNGHIPKDG